MSFFRDCWLSIRGTFRECLSTPLSKKKLLIFGGVFLALVILIIILVATLHSSSSPSTPAKGSDALNNGIAFLKNDTAVLKTKYTYEFNKNLDSLKQYLNLNGYPKDLHMSVWSVGASDCKKAFLKDAVPQTLEGIDAVVRLTEKFNDRLQLSRSVQDIKNSKSNGITSVLISLDGGYTIDSRLAVLRMMQRAGVSMMVLTGPCSTPWAGNYIDINTTLNDFGKAVVLEANRMGIVLDLAGSSHLTIDAALAATASAVIFNGVGAKTLSSNAINLDDAIMPKIKTSHSVVLVSFQCANIQTSANNCTADAVIQHINHLAEKVGKSGVGLSMDFGKDTAAYPPDLQNLNDVQKLFDKLHDRDNWTVAELEGLAITNFLNVMESAENVAKTQLKNTDPYDVLEPLNDLGAKDKLTCYSDTDIRYPTTPKA